MQTTLRIDDELYREAKAEAAREGVTLTRFLEDGLRLRLQKVRRSSLPPVDLTNRQGQPREIAKPEDEANAYRHLVIVPGVCGGATIIEGTRIGVHDVMGLILNGESVEGVQRSFPDLTRAQIYECLAYYEDHRTEIDALVAEQMSEPQV
jgi:uncharacterized protein (DUF433 family)